METLQFLHGLPQHFGAEDCACALRYCAKSAAGLSQRSMEDCKGALLDGLPVEQAPVRVA